MAVYVDDMRAPYGSLIMCHMLADTDDELHAMADAIGVKRIWWQSPEKTSGSHYDICLSKKAIALRFGAIPITKRQAAAMNAHRKALGSLNTPSAAMDWLRASRRQQQPSGDARALSVIAESGADVEAHPVATRLNVFGRLCAVEG